MTSNEPEPTSQHDLDDLRRRVQTTRRVADPWAGDPARGVSATTLDELLAYWADGYDWQAHESRIRALPWQQAGPLRVVHQRAAAEDAPVVVLLHGWPDSVLRFERLLPLLTDVHVVVPALPGFPFALPVSEAPSVTSVAADVVAALDALGYDRVVLSGGDIGGTVAEIIAGAHPHRVGALHLTDVSPHHARAVDPGSLTDEGRAYLGTAAGWFRENGGYIAVQSTRPATLAAALGDSPVGLAAWLVEKLTGWSQTPFALDDVLTWVSAYWFTGAIGTSFSTYAMPAVVPDRVDVPTVFSAFPRDIKPAPRAYIEHFVNLQRLHEHEAGGHFAAWEQPEQYARDLLEAGTITAG